MLFDNSICFVNKLKITLENYSRNSLFILSLCDILLEVSRLSLQGYILMIMWWFLLYHVNIVSITAVYISI